MLIHYGLNESLNKFRWGLTSLFEFGRVLTEFGGIWTSLDVDSIWRRLSLDRDQRSLNEFGHGFGEFGLVFDKFGQGLDGFEQVWTGFGQVSIGFGGVWKGFGGVWRSLEEFE